MATVTILCMHGFVNENFSFLIVYVYTALRCVSVLVSISPFLVALFLTVALGDLDELYLYL